MFIDFREREIDHLPPVRVPIGDLTGSLLVPYFAIHNTLPRIRCTHNLVLPIYNAHPYFSPQKIWAKCSLYTANFSL